MNRQAKKVASAIAIVAMSVAGLAACGGGSSEGDGGGSSSKDGKVYYLQFKPEAKQAWDDIAAKYTQETGVQVQVVTAADGTYESTLKAQITKDDAPTIFQVNGPVGLAVWKDYCADISDSEIYNQLNDQSVALKEGDSVVAVPWVNETYGIIYNKDLLNKYIALDGAVISDASDINNFATLKAVADDIQARKSELGVDGAFTSAGMDSSSDWRFKTHLANMPLFYEFRDDNVTDQPATIKGTYLDNYKQIWDLYLTDSTTDRKLIGSKLGSDAVTEFATGKAVFYQNGTWAWTDLQADGVSADSLGMLPIYIGVDGEEKQGLTTGSENYWCINKDASQADQKASLDFLNWMITSDEGKAALSSDMGFVTPFKSMNDVETDNPLVAIAKEDTANADTYPVTWNFTMMPSETWKNELGAALLGYAQGSNDWSEVQSKFVDGWATEYAAAHEGSGDSE